MGKRLRRKDCRRNPEHSRRAECTNLVCCNPEHWYWHRLIQRARHGWWVGRAYDEPYLTCPTGTADAERQVAEEALAGDTDSLLALGFCAWNNENYAQWQPTVRAILANRYADKDRTEAG